MYIFRGRGVFINVYKADDNFVTSGTTLLSDLDLRETYRAIDSVVTGRLPSLSCATTYYFTLAVAKHNKNHSYTAFNLLVFNCCIAIYVTSLICVLFFITI